MWLSKAPSLKPEIETMWPSKAPSLKPEIETTGLSKAPSLKPKIETMWLSKAPFLNLEKKSNRSQRDKRKCIYKVKELGPPAPEVINYTLFLARFRLQRWVNVWVRMRAHVCFACFNYCQKLCLSTFCLPGSFHFVYSQSFLIIKRHMSDS